MTSNEYDYLNAIIPIICFLVPAYELIFKKTEEKGLKKVSNIGWVLLIIAILWGTIEYFSIKQTTADKTKEKHLSDSSRTADKKEIIDSIKKQRSFDTATLIHDKTIIIYSKDSLNYYGVPNISLSGLNSFKAS
ncbi:MAG TPA: hypothetical protein VMU83_19935 [Hanamia sp.]|nr:hypothetical protein [Hanamia sp.]